RELAGRHLAADAAGDAAQQVQRLLGRAEPVQRRYLFKQYRRVSKAAQLGSIRRLARAWRVDHDELARDGRLPGYLSARATGHLDVDRDEPVAARGWCRDVPLALGPDGPAGQPYARSDSRDGAVRRGLREQRGHSQSCVPLGQLEAQLE